MRTPRSTLRGAMGGAVVALAVLLVGVAVAFWHRERITPLTFAKIRLGMSPQELRGLLVSPDFQAIEFGRIDGQERYFTNSIQTQDERRRRGYREYKREQWSSRQLTIIAVSSLDGRVVARYTGSG